MCFYHTRNFFYQTTKAFLCLELKGGFEIKGDYYDKTALNWVKMKVFPYGV